MGRIGQRIPRWGLASWLVFGAAFVWLSRMPGHSYLVLGGGLAAVVALLATRQLRLPTTSALPLFVALGVCGATSLAALVSERPGVLGSYALDLVGPLLVAVAVLCRDAPRGALAALSWGATVGLGLTWLIGLAEVISGAKLMLWLRPTTSTAPRLAADRWLAQSVFINSNDFAVAMAVLATVVGARFLFDSRRSRAVMRARAGLVVTAAAMAAYSMSRGALLALACGVVLLCTMAVRDSRPRLIDRRIQFAALLAVAIAGVLLWRSDFVQNTSTSEREGIVTRGLAILGAHPWESLAGFGSMARYQAVAAEAFGPVLMDPHNIGLELVIAYGALGALAVVAAWVWVVWRAIIQGRGTRYSLAFAAFSVVALLPLLGVVPSQFLPYGYLWLSLIAAFGWLRSTPTSAGETALP